MKTKSIRKKITGGMCAVALPVCVLQLSANPAEAACGAHPDGVNDYYMCNTKEEALSLCENTPTPTQGVDPGGSWSCSWSGWNGEDGYRGIGLYDLNGDGNKTQRFVAWFAAESGFVDPSPPIPTPNNGPCGCELTNPCDANPIRISTGNKYEEVTDSSSGGIMPLVIKRSYNSELKGWRFNGVASLNIKANSILYASDGGKGITLTESGGIWSTPDQPGVELTFNTEESLWVLVDQTLTRRKFDESGMLVLIENSQGVTHSLTYDTDGRLLTISRSLGGSLAYQYNNVGLITNITTESGATYDYTYSGVNLITVGYPGGAQINYHYEDSRHYYALTGVTNELGDRFSTWAYDAAGRAISSEHAGGVERFDFVYNADGSTTVTNPLGKDTTYHFTQVNGVNKLTLVEGHASENCAAANKAYTYYSGSGLLETKTDWMGRITRFEYNNRGLEIKRVEAEGTPAESTVTTEWHQNFPVRIKVVKAGRETLFTYDNAGRQLTKTVKAASAGQ